MASNGLTQYAKKGKCRICQRVRKTSTQVKAVGEVHHGFAVGHIWECIDREECNRAAKAKLGDENRTNLERERIKLALSIGRYKEYVYYS